MTDRSVIRVNSGVFTLNNWLTQESFSNSAYTQRHLIILLIPVISENCDVCPRVGEMISLLYRRNIVPAIGPNEDKSFSEAQLVVSL